MSRQGEARRRLDAATATLERLAAPVVDPRLQAELAGANPITLDRLRHKIADQLGGWGTARTEGGGGDGPQAWCWDDEQEVSACHRAGGRGDGACKGEPISGPSDRTGETAANGNRDQAQQDDLALNGLLAELHGITVQIDAIASRYLDPILHKGAPGCDLCRIKQDDGTDGWSQIHVTATNLDGLLGTSTDGEPIRKSVCQWHYRWSRKAGRLPNRAEVKAHLAGHKVDPPKVGAR